MASLADALVKHNMLGQDTRAVAVAVAPIFLAPPTNRNPLVRISGGLSQQLINLQSYSRRVISTLRTIAAEKIKQQTIIERIDRQEKENRAEMTRLQPERRVEKTEESEDDSDLIATFLRMLGGAIARIINAITDGIRRIINAVRGILPTGIGLLRALPLLMMIFRRNPIALGFGIGAGIANLLGRGADPSRPPQPEGGSTQREPPSGDFMSEVNRVSSRFGINPTDLLALMRAESSLNPQAVNPTTGATGLIQFMPATARSLGTTVEELRQMTAAQQMQYVERFFESVGLPQGASSGLLYAYVFLPGRARSAVQRGDGILTRSGESYYNANVGLDVNRDGIITITDLDARMARFGGTQQASRMQRATGIEPTASTPRSPSSSQPTQQSGRGPQISSTPTITSSVQQTASFVPQQHATAGILILPVMVGA